VGRYSRPSLKVLVIAHHTRRGPRVYSIIIASLLVVLPSSSIIIDVSMDH
jgi:hypothetical protein